MQLLDQRLLRAAVGRLLAQRNAGHQCLNLRFERGICLEERLLLLPDRHQLLHVLSTTATLALQLRAQLGSFHGPRIPLKSQFIGFYFHFRD